jgi:hypothetical protein
MYFLSPDATLSAAKCADILSSIFSPFMFWVVPTARWPNHGSLLPCDNRRPHSLQEVEKRRSLCRTDDPTIRIWRDRLDRSNLKMSDKMLRSYLYEAANVLLTRVANGRRSKPGASGLRSAAGCVKPRLPSLESLLSFCTGCGSKAANSSGHQRRLINLHSRTKPNSRRPAGINVPAGTLAFGAIAPGFAMLERAKRASHVDPPASSYAIMRRAGPYRGENPGPGKDVEGELEPRPGIREQPGSDSAVPLMSGPSSPHPDRGWRKARVCGRDAVRHSPFGINRKPPCLSEKPRIV